MSEEPSKTPEEIDAGLAFAYGEDSARKTSPSVVGRIGEITGSRPKVLLRDDTPGDAPLLKPLGPDDRLEAGKYVVQGELGRGGVGTVNRGHDQDLGRDVAMKFLHDKYKDHPEVLHRFVEEAQIGGQLQHPGIVPVYDLGMVDGRPFFAMKLVKGQTLAKKLTDRESPTDDARTYLAIFEDVCQTLAYAHARGVVHRDLKPANIMIGSFGEVQVVDWGMGKVMPTGGVADEKVAAERHSNVSIIETVRSGGHGTQSLMGSVMGTPAYMPPEQARGDVDAMDERSDVFALGAILCEILTGKPPYIGPVDEQIGMAAMAKLDAAHARLEACDGEQEMIELAMRCLMPAPAARPKSAGIVARAVHEHLAAVESRVHQARVEAAEAKVRAEALKRTQKLGISLTAVIALGLLVSLWLWRAADTAATNEILAREAAVASAKEAKQKERLAIEQTEIAERELARAVEIKNLITEMLQSVDPDQARGADITLLKGILDTASKRLTDGAIQDELVAAELHTLTGCVYRSIGLYAEAELHLPVALEIRERVLGAEHPDALLLLDHLGLLYTKQGRYQEAEAIHLHSLEITRRVLGEEHANTLMILGLLASLYRAQGRFDEGETLCRPALKTAQRAMGEEHPLALYLMGNLASIYTAQGRYSEAESLYLQAREIEDKLWGENHPSTLLSEANLALVYAQQGLYEKAEAIHVHTLEVSRRVLGEEHPTTLASLGNLAAIYRQQGRNTEAEPLLLDALEVQQRVLGEEHLHTLTTRVNLGRLYRSQTRFDESEAMFLETLETAEHVLGDEHPTTLILLTSLAQLLRDQGRMDEARTLFLQSLETEERVLGEDHPYTLTTVKDLASLEWQARRYARAETLYLLALERENRSLGEDHAQTLDTAVVLSRLYISTGRFEDGLALLEDTLSRSRRVFGRQDPRTVAILRALVTTHEAQGRSADALPFQRELFDLQVASADAVDASDTVLNAAAWDLLTIENESLRDPERALGMAQRACALAEEARSDQLWAYLDTLALAQHRTGDRAAAFETQERAVALMPLGAAPEVLERLVEYEAALKDR
tara:strand:+ start:3551 stop:6751 length:3201 start_codon:yes stop_codon:yes gene_type:complete